MGSQEFDMLTEGDMRYRQFQKKNIVAACEIPAGTRITLDKVRFKRAGRGFSPAERTVVIGRRAARPIAPHQPIVPEDLEV